MEGYNATRKSPQRMEEQEEEEEEEEEEEGGQWRTILLRHIFIGKFINL